MHNTSLPPIQLLIDPEVAHTANLSLTSHFWFMIARKSISQKNDFQQIFEKDVLPVIISEKKILKNQN